MSNISEHISYREATRSITALRYGINNTPNAEQLFNMVSWAENIFEPLRLGLGGFPIGIGSFFRCNDLNDVIGGSINSQHMALRGAAGDLDNDRYTDGPTNLDIFNYIRSELEFDQLIWEFGTDNMPDWVHGSFWKNHNRNQILKAIKIGRTTKYITI